MTEWTSKIKSVAARWSATPAAIWNVGVIWDDVPNPCALEFANPTPERIYSNIVFNTDIGINHDAYLSAFDTAGIKVLLSFEPGDADPKTIIDLILLKFQAHSCVIGILMDTEWYKSRTSRDGARVTDALAQDWESRVKSYNPNYRLALKHWDKSHLPPSYRSNIIFAYDGQQFSGLSAMVSDFSSNFASAFPSNDIWVQICYPDDKSWWSKLTDPVTDIGNALRVQCPQTNGVFWVDFSFKDYR